MTGRFALRQPSMDARIWVISIESRRVGLDSSGSPQGCMPELDHRGRRVGSDLHQAFITGLLAQKLLNIQIFLRVHTYNIIRISITDVLIQPPDPFLHFRWTRSLPCAMHVAAKE